MTNSKLLHVLSVYGSKGKDEDGLQSSSFRETAKSAVLRITKCYRTVSDTVALILVEIPPANLLITKGAHVKTKMTMELLKKKIIKSRRENSRSTTDMIGGPRKQPRLREHVKFY